MEQCFKRYPVDDSALIHLAVHGKTHSNIFRLEVQLRSAVRPGKLQQAADAAAVRFPMLAAGIRKQGNQFVVVPRPEALNIWVDRQPLAWMSEKELRDCAMRVLYGHRHIAVEFFHSLTDGTGGLRFLSDLLAAYLEVPAGPAPGREAWEDSYQKYAAGKTAALPGGTSYLFPAAPQEEKIFRTTWTFSAEAVRAGAQAEHTTITALFAALFAQTAMEFQRAEKRPGKPLLPVQVMVPVDLRRRFPSASLRNFSLYALPGLAPEAADAPFSQIAGRMTEQLRTQNEFLRLRAAITTNVELERKTAFLPLGLKCSLLRAGFEAFGGRSSCITVSNLGRAVFPDRVQREIVRLDLLLTPRLHSPYNCGIATVGDVLSLTITRRGKEMGVEKVLLAHLRRQGIAPSVAEAESFAPF